MALLEEKTVQKEPEFNLSKEISILFRRGRVFMDNAIGDHYLGSGLFAIIFFLNNNNGASQDEISKKMEIEKTTITRGLARLEEEGLILRKVDEKDRRVNRVFLTEKGLETIPKLEVYSGQWKDVLMDGFTSAEKEELERLMKKMSENAQQFSNSRCKKGGIHDK